VSVHPADIAVIALCAAPVVAVGPEFSPLSAGLLGAVLASMRKSSFADATASLGKATIAAGRWLATLLSGAAATVFGSPAICANAGIEAGHTMALVYFAVGLVGSTIVDLVISRDRAIAEKILARFPGAKEEKQ
jgi:hypothetical protein